MDNNKNVKELINELKQEIQWIKELNELLSLEKDVLATRKFEQLEELADKKQDLSTKLEDSTKERMKLIGDTNSLTAKNSLQNFLKSCSTSEANQINKLNTELTEQLTICRDLNTVNGQVIAANVYMRQEIVSVLSGNKVRDVSVYTATGDIKNPGGSEGTHHQKA